MKIPVSNTTAMPIYVGACMIPAGETMHFEESEVPDHLRPAPASAEAPAAPDNPIATLAKESIKTITAAFAEMSIEQIDALGEYEQQSEAPRKGLLSAISEELLKRAAETELAAAIKALKDLDDAGLAKALEDEKAKGETASAEHIAAIEAEIKARAEAEGG